tara:strand:+ start:161 stop:370 length:210 start_codon:yes stop_codon:yes gene_type:complete
MEIVIVIFIIWAILLLCLGYYIANKSKIEMTFKLDEVIEIAQYVRVSSQSIPDARTKELVNEYLLAKNK